MDPLLQPLQIKGLSLKNRVMSTAHEPAYAEDGKPKLRYQLYHEEKARGGLALTMIGGSTNVAPDSPAVFGQLYAGDDSIIPWFRQLSDRVHVYDTAVMCQLTHMGRRTISDAGDWLPTIAPSPVREPAHRSFPKEMSQADIDRVVKAFGQAAWRCREGRLDGIELIAYGHLIDQFWTPLVNRRTDRYGGSLENRMRFSLEVLAEVRERVGDDFIIGIRMSGDEHQDGGLSREDCIAIARGLVKTGMLDFVNVIEGFIGTDEAIRHVIPVTGTPTAPHLQLAAAVKEAVDIPVFHAARITDLPTARWAISEGLIDMVGMTRAHMADPHIVAKLERGEEDRIRPCVGASYCLNRIYAGYDALCIHNPATGREETIPHVVQPATPTRRVVVVGAGPAGLEAARVSAERGHRVTLVEATGHAGGQVRLAAMAVDRRRELIGIVDWLTDEVVRAGVDLRLNHLVDGAGVLELSPEVVIVATGGLPDTEILEEGNDLVVSTWDVITSQVRPKGRTLVYDDHGGEQALSCVERLIEAGVEIEVVTPDRLVGHDVIGTLYPGYLELFYTHGVTLTTDRRLKSVRRDNGRLLATMYNEYSKTTEERIADLVVVEHGTLPNADVYHQLVDHSLNLGELDIDAFIELRPQEMVLNPEGAYRLYRIGDAVAHRNIHAAIYDARRLCMLV